LAPVLLLSALLCGTGAALGAARSAVRSAPDRPGVVLPDAFARVLRLGAPSLAGLAALLAMASAIGLLHYEVQAIRGQQDATVGRAPRVAAIENVVLAPDLGVDVAGLALAARFERGPLPVDDDERD